MCPRSLRCAERTGHAALLLLAGLLAACVSTRAIPPPTPPAYAAPPAASGPLAELDRQLRARHSRNESSFELLDRNEDALTWRIALADAAVSSIDLQYYIWWGDESGDLLMKHVVAAAHRGVHVRLIIDDLSTILKGEAHPKVPHWPALELDAHHNIEIRLFNAWSQEALVSRGVDLLSRADRMNQRMHNKLMIVDNRATVVGGRNIGNEYFGLATDLNFCDFDVVGIGSVALQASAVFDRFWNSHWVTPVPSLKLGDAATDLPAGAPAVRATLASSPDIRPFALDPDPTALSRLAGSLSPGTSLMLTDTPTSDALVHHLPRAMDALMRSARHELLIANAYIIPDDSMIDLLHQLTQQGVTVRMLTNSLASQDVPAVNSHYKKWRKRLLQAGVELHELRDDAAIRTALADTPPSKAKFVSLHIKSLVIDRHTVFVGSMNLDPRSATLNTEMGVIVNDPQLAQQTAAALDEDMQPANSWRVTLDSAGHLTWGDGTATVTRQPARSAWQRCEDLFFMLFPRSLY